jgi:signal transduction histidine kinase
MRSFSIKRRIVTAVVVTELILVVCLLLLAGYMIRSNAIRSFDASLHGRAMSIAALIRYTEGPHPELQFDGTLLPRPLTKDVPDLFRIETHDGHLLATSTAPPPMSGVQGQGAESWEFSFAGSPYRALCLRDVPVLDSEEGLPKSTATLNVTYAASTRELRASLARAFLSILLGGIVLLAISVYVSIQAIERGLRPLSELAAGVNSISPTDWDLKLTDSSVAVVEVAPLTRAMSRMVETLRAAFQQQRDFTSNAAHELRTPVAILKSTLQSLLQESRTGEMYRAGIADALCDLGRLETLLHSMLRLARAEQHAGSGERSELSKVDVVGTCEAAIARLTPLAQTRGTTITLAAPADVLPVHAEPEDLEIIWANLLENAIRYGPPNSEVKMTAARRDGSVSVAVEDNGPGIAPGELSRIFERFHRGDHSRSRESGGYGLGLAIAKAFVECYGGSIAASSVAESGTRIGVELPISH